MMTIDKGEHVIILRSCPCCGTNHKITVDAADWAVYNKGELIQNAFPRLSAEERELIKTGICPTCWDKLTGDV